MTKFEAGQRVKVLVDKAYSTERGMRGRKGTVLHNAASSDVVAYVKLDGANTDDRYVLGASESCEVFGNGQLMLVESETKKASQKISVDEVQVGDEIVAFWNARGVEYRQKGTVGEMFAGVPYTAEGRQLVHNSYGKLADHIYLLNRPEPKKPEIEDGVYYVTCAVKGVGPWRVSVVGGVADWKYGEDWESQAFGDYETLVKAKTDSQSDLTFHTEDPTPKGFDALDKSKKYLVKHSTQPDAGHNVLLAFVGGAWNYTYFDTLSAWTLAGHFEDWFANGTSRWEKPVEWVEPELTDLEKFTKAGYVGQKFTRPNGDKYKVSRKGNVKAKYNDDEYWSRLYWDFTVFDHQVRDGDFVKI